VLVAWPHNRKGPQQNGHTRNIGSRKRPQAERAAEKAHESNGLNGRTCEIEIVSKRVRCRKKKWPQKMLRG
jgi:hypothetical protein